MSEATTPDGILEALGPLARRELGIDAPLRREQRLLQDLQLDSIRLLTLAVAVEDHFRILLDETDEERLETVGDLVDLVVRKLGARSGG